MAYGRGHEHGTRHTRKARQCDWTSTNDWAKVMLAEVERKVAAELAAQKMGK